MQGRFANRGKSSKSCRTGLTTLCDFTSPMDSIGVSDLRSLRESIGVHESDRMSQKANCGGTKAA